MALQTASTALLDPRLAGRGVASLNKMMVWANGDVEGARNGLCVGPAEVGDSVGLLVVGLRVGERVGEREGLVVVGEAEGARVGEYVVGGVGDFVGDLVGDCVTPAQKQIRVDVVVLQASVLAESQLPPVVVPALSQVPTPDVEPQLLHEVVGAALPALSQPDHAMAALVTAASMRSVMSVLPPKKKLAEEDTRVLLTAPYTEPLPGKW